ncbi:Hsp20/alpha crystallin family protein [Candidatus Micrarchaeota archaeon]|jgi:HSP20 family protein|nr:Hsp20/alpha crystallin family protein [Candidatus Micrarchaeota archaeon]
MRRWTIWDEVQRMQEEMDSLFNLRQSNLPMLTNKQGINTYSAPLSDIIEKEDEIVYIMDIPGVEKKDIQLEVIGNRLEVKTEKKEEIKREAEGYIRYERSYGGFKRTFALPETADPNQVNATYKNGVLEITVKKKPDSKKEKKRIEVN